MKGVILADGQPVPTPMASQLRNLLTESPSKRVDLINVLDRNPPIPTFQGFTNELDDSNDEKENAPPDGNSAPSSPSSSPGSSPLSERTPQAKPKRRSSVKPEGTLHANPSTDSLGHRPKSAVPQHLRGMQRTASAPAVWNTEDDDDIPSPFLKRVDRNMVKASSQAPAKALTLEKKTSKSALKQDSNGATAGKNPPKATGIKTRLSAGKPISRTVSSRP
ncbi:hypothetical protein CPB86DRAFT_712872 [Serendipita vermifera]|nr:hypothetical protein CPB86DRAFT_712872 [Serendipita vermifera]